PGDVGDVAGVGGEQRHGENRHEDQPPHSEHVGRGQRGNGRTRPTTTAGHTGAASDFVRTHVATPGSPPILSSGRTTKPTAALSPTSQRSNSPTLQSRSPTTTRSPSTSGAWCAALPTISSSTDSTSTSTSDPIRSSAR